MNLLPAKTKQARARLAIRHVPIGDLREDRKNVRLHDERNLEAIEASLKTWGQVEPLVVQKGKNRVIGGNGRLRVLKKLGHATVPIVEVDVDDLNARALAVALNRTGELASWDTAALAETLKGLADSGLDLEILGFTEDAVAGLLNRLNYDGGAESHGKLAAKFLVPPFTLLDSRQGYWRERKAAWLGLGIQSEIGRGDNLLHMSPAMLARNGKKNGKAKTFGTEGNIGGDWTGTSIFDPVLCEIAYRWFCPSGAAILDPFAGGSVRGITAAALGHRYTGIDLRGEQVKANEAQWAKIGPGLPLFAAAAAPEPEATITDPAALTPVQERDGVYVKRDDLFSFNGATGGKGRSGSILAKDAKGLVAGGASNSPMLSRVAQIAQGFGIPCRIHTGKRKDPTPEMLAAQEAGAELVLHSLGRLNVVLANAKKDAEERGWRLVPWGLEAEEAVAATKEQTLNIPAKAKRIVVPVGSGMTLAAILQALYGDVRPIIGVCVGGDPSERLDRWAPKDWRKRVKLVPAATPYEQPAPATHFFGLDLDPFYEAKAAPHAQPGDLFWVVARGSTPSKARPASTAKPEPPRWITGDSQIVLGHGPQAQPGRADYDFIFTCPPYADLETYSQDPADLSNMTYPMFLDAYQAILKGAVQRLRPDRFACIVVGEVRDPKGINRGLVPATIDAMEAAGAAYYNEAVYIQPAGTLALRAGRTFEATRKLGKTHQNVLVFVKGDPVKATQALAQPEYGDAPTEDPDA